METLVIVREFLKYSIYELISCLSKIPSTHIFESINNKHEIIMCTEERTNKS